MEIQKAYPGLKPYNRHVKWRPESRNTPAQSLARGLPKPQGESLLEPATNLAVQRPHFVAKSHASGDANHTTKHTKMKSIHPRV